jgi:hypothetical protein
MAAENGFSNVTTTGVNQDGLVMPVSDINVIGAEGVCSGLKIG